MLLAAEMWIGIRMPKAERSRAMSINQACFVIGGSVGPVAVSLLNKVVAAHLVADEEQARRSRLSMPGCADRM